MALDLNVKTCLSPFPLPFVIGYTPIPRNYFHQYYLTDRDLNKKRIRKGDRQLFGFKTHFRKGKRGAMQLFKLFRPNRLCSATALFPDVLKSHP